MKINKKNAFSINSFNGGFFPFSFSYKKHSNGINTLEICPQCLLDLTDLIACVALDKLILFRLRSNSLGENISFFEFLNQNNIEFEKIQTEDCRINTRDLKFILNELDHYNISLFDSSSDSSLDEIKTKLAYCRSKQDEVQSSVILNTDFGSNLYLSSHDDCYLTVESSSDSFLLNIIQVTLSTLCFEQLSLKKEGAVSIQVPMEEINRLLSSSSEWTVLEKHIVLDDETLVLSFSSQPFSFTDLSSIDTLSWELRYNTVKKQWSSVEVSNNK